MNPDRSDISPGPALSFKQRLAVNAGLALVLAILLSAGWLAERNITAAAESDRWQTHTHVVIGELGDLLSSLKDAETGQRGFIITGDEKYLEPYRASLGEIGTHLASLRRLTADNPRQQQRLAAITSLVEARLAGIAERIALRETKGFDAAKEALITGGGKAIMGELRALVGQAQREEEGLLRGRVATKEADTRKTSHSVVLGGTLGGVALLGLFIFLRRELARRHRAESALRQEQEALRESERRLRHAADAAELGIWALEPAGDRVLWENGRPYEIFGIPRNDAPVTAARFAAEFVHPEDLAAFEQAIGATVQTGARLSYQGRFRRPDGGQRWVEFTGQPEHAPDGTCRRVLGTVQDITARKQAEASLRQNAGLFATLVAQAPGGVYVVDAQFRMQQVNAQALPAFAAVDPLIGRDLAEVLEIIWGPEVGGQLTAIFRHTLETGERYISPRFSEQRHDIGVEQAYEWETQRVTLPDGQHGVVCYFTEVTERARAAAALRDSEERLRLALAVGGMGVWVVDLTPGGATTFDEQACRLMGLDPACRELAMSEILEKVIHPDDRERIQTAMSRIVEGDRGEVIEYRMIHPDGAVIWLQGDGTTQRDAAGTPVRFIGVNFDITERKRAEEEIRKLNATLEQKVTERTEALRASEERFRAIADNIPQLAWLADSEGYVGWFNKGWLDYTGTTLEDNQGPGWKAVHHPDYVEAVAEKFERHLREGRDWEDTFPLRGKDGQYRWFLSRMKVIRDETGKVVRFFGTNTDVTERRQNEEALRKQSAEAEQTCIALAEKAAELALTAKYKSEFLANMSHELRTPLNSILIFSQVLAENAAGNLTAKQVEFSQHIRSSGTDLLNLISDILDLSKIESGTVSVAIGEIPVAGLRDTIDRNFRHMAEAKNLPFHVQFAEGLPQAMDSDPRRLGQILKNLLSNAIKFTARGKVEVRVDLATEGWSADHPVLGKAGQVIAFAVEDTGIGIAPDKQRLIFESFQQADAGTARKYGGTGLGLAISRELAVLLGGEIRLASTEGEGSTFTLFLPLHYSGPEKVRRAPAQSAKGIPPVIRTPAGGTPMPLPDEALRGRKVLVVDDDARNIFALTSLLENHGMDVLTATSGRSAIDLIVKTPGLSLVLMDIMMPGMDGYETMREIRKRPEHRTLPILALTAKAMKDDREKCLEAGASDYIAKPVNTDQLLALMRGWLVR